MFYYDEKTKSKIEFDYLILMGSDDDGSKVFYLHPTVHDELVIFLRTVNYYDQIAIRLAYANRKVMYS